MSNLLLIKAGQNGMSEDEFDNVTFVDEPSHAMFDVEYHDQNLPPIKGLVFEGTYDLSGQTMYSYSLELKEIDHFGFKRDGNKVTISIHRKIAERVEEVEVITFISSTLRVWFPSPDKGSHAFREVTLDAIAHQTRFVCKLLEKRNFYCDIKVKDTH